MGDDKILLTTDEAARLLGLTAGQLAVWRQRGVGPSYLKIDGWRVRYESTAIEHYRRIRMRAVAPESRAAASR